MATLSPMHWLELEAPQEAERFNPKRLLCEDGVCLGVLHLVSSGSPFRGVTEAVCPICGRSQALPIPQSPSER